MSHWSVLATIVLCPNPKNVHQNVRRPFTKNVDILRHTSRQYRRMYRIPKTAIFDKIINDKFP